MIPNYLKIINFMNHKNSIIEFSSLPNAVIIIGMEDNSTDKSNAVGKSTLFNAIHFALFDETVSKKSRVIRRGQNKCEVIFIFEMSDGKKYKIHRTRTKTSKNVYFYVYEEDWNNISCRTNSQTEDFICKIIGVSQRIFKNSSYFKQKDDFDLAEAKPEKRKAIIMDMLHMKEWKVYEKIAKEKKNEIEKEISILENTLPIFGDPKEDLIKNKKTLDIIIYNIDKKTKKVFELERTLSEKRIQLSTLDNKNRVNLKDIREKISSEKIKLNNTNKQIIYSLNIKNEKQTRLDKISKMYIDYDGKFKNLVIEEANLNKNKIINVSIGEYNKTCKDLTCCIDDKANKLSLINQLNGDIPTDDFCPTCFSELNENIREKNLQLKNSKIQNLSDDVNKLEKKIDFLRNKKKKYDKKMDEYKLFVDKQTKIKKDIDNIKMTLKAINDETDLINSLLLEIDSQIIEHSKIKENTECLIKELNNEIESRLSDSIDEDIYRLKNETNTIYGNCVSEKNNLSVYMVEKGSIEKSIETNKENINKLEELNIKLLAKKHELSIYKSVIFVFGSSGLPGTIISTVLDSLQNEANSVLNTLRPEIQIQFFLEKEKCDGSYEDTLGMKFFVNSMEWDYDELSGGQQGCIALALKFAISVINRKRCGADIKMLLLDEVDQALDIDGINSFCNVIKEWSNDMKILVITHNERLKENFNSFILVSKRGGISSVEVIR